MKKLAVILFLTLSAVATDEPKFPPMPVPVSGNAVAALKGGFELFSMMGIGPKKTWDDVTNKVYIMTIAHAGKWAGGRAVPGPVGRLYAAAAGAKGLVVLMGGFTLDNQGEQLIVPDVNIYEPGARRWSRGKDIPVPVDSAVTGVIHDRFVYLIGGRSASGPVNYVQIYDVEKDEWTQGTPLPGTPAFGMAGGIGDDAIVVVDGARPGPIDGPKYIAADECWFGKLDKKDPAKIEWSKLPAHPGTARFGIAAGAAEKDHRIYFSGGTPNPHDYKGLPYAANAATAKPADPKSDEAASSDAKISDGNIPDAKLLDAKVEDVSNLTFAFDVHGHKWETLTDQTVNPRLDGRGLVETPLGPVVIGGLAQNNAVTAGVTLFPKK